MRNLKDHAIEAWRDQVERGVKAKDLEALVELRKNIERATDRFERLVMIKASRFSLKDFLFGSTLGNIITSREILEELEKYGLSITWADIVPVKDITYVDQLRKALNAEERTILEAQKLMDVVIKDPSYESGAALENAVRELAGRLRAQVEDFDRAQYRLAEIRDTLEKAKQEEGWLNWAWSGIAGFFGGEETATVTPAVEQEESSAEESFWSEESVADEEEAPAAVEEPAAEQEEIAAEEAATTEEAPAVVSAEEERDFLESSVGW